MFTFRALGANFVRASVFILAAGFRFKAGPLSPETNRHRSELMWWPGWKLEDRTDAEWEAQFAGRIHQVEWFRTSAAYQWAELHKGPLPPPPCPFRRITHTAWERDRRNLNLA